MSARIIAIDDHKLLRKHNFNLYHTMWANEMILQAAAATEKKPLKPN